MKRLLFGWDFEVDAWSRLWRWNLIMICERTCNKTKRSYFESRTQPSGPLCLWQCFGHSEQLENFTEIYWAHKTCKAPQAWASTVITKGVIQNLDIFYILFPSFESFYHLSTALIAFTSCWQLRQLIKDLNYLNSFCQVSGILVALKLWGLIKAVDSFDSSLVAI